MTRKLVWAGNGLVAVPLEKVDSWSITVQGGDTRTIVTAWVGESDYDVWVKEGNKLAEARAWVAALYQSPEEEE